MPIPESQLQTWANPYDTEAARNGHKAVRRAFELHRSVPWLSSIHDYLQGSYRNSTSIWRDADVDLVVEWTSACWSDISQLSEPEQAAWQRDFSPSAYSFETFRADVIDALNH
ncbi:MAG: nucleotidyltransferase, partial [Chloroflexota bacterium]|nr:nucleotidyltransferase [Chloroflexota bacterium]